jgi:hypothetical protein
LKAINASWSTAIADNVTWPFMALANRSLPATGVTQVGMRVQMTPYSIGYCDLPYAKGMPHFSFSIGGHTVSANLNSLTITLKSAFKQGDKPGTDTRFDSH